MKTLSVQTEMNELEKKLNAMAGLGPAAYLSTEAKEMKVRLWELRMKEMLYPFL